jgi:hypothetical protein
MMNAINFFLFYFYDECLKRNDSFVIKKLLFSLFLVQLCG